MGTSGTEEQDLLHRLGPVADLLLSADASARAQDVEVRILDIHFFSRWVQSAKRINTFANPVEILLLSGGASAHAEDVEVQICCIEATSYTKTGFSLMLLCQMTTQSLVSRVSNLRGKGQGKRGGEPELDIYHVD